jgi:hypothetical protein
MVCVLRSILLSIPAVLLAACASGPDSPGPGPSSGVEACNGLDDDGNGLVDEDPSGTGSLTEPCTTACGAGTRICLGGTWSGCSAPEPGPDGSCPCIEGETRPCATACGPGVETCVSGVFVGCTAPEPEDELCGDGVDNDCDGETDEDCGDCSPGETRPCGTDTGECEAGIRTCRPDGSWGGCAGNRGPEEELCDGLDNDCDGETDEDAPVDGYEANDSCPLARRLPDVLEDASLVAVDASIHPAGDEDWFWIRAVEGWHDCEPFTGQCHYDLSMTLEPPAGADLVACLTPAWPSDAPACDVVGDPGNTHCTDPGDPGMVLEWTGICMLDDSLDFVVEVRARPGSIPACDPYTLSFWLDGPTEVCPEP